MELTQVSENVYEIAQEGEMHVPARVYASEPLLAAMEDEGQTLQQVRNVATLPGIRKYSVVLPDGSERRVNVTGEVESGREKIVKA